MIPNWFAKIEAELKPYRYAYHHYNHKGMAEECSMCDEKMRNLRDVMIEAEIEFRESFQ